MKTRKVTIAEDVEIPGKAETIVDVFIERSEADDEDSTADFLVEPTDGFKDKYQLVLASTLVDINRAATAKVRILNPFPVDVKLRQYAVIGKAEKVEKIVSIVSEAEHNGETGNLNKIRRIKVAKEVEEESTISLPKACSEDIPSHLSELYNEAVKNRTSEEAEIIAGLLVKHEHTFSKDEWDIGLTNLVEHPIKTNGAEPIKQRPRRVPLAYADEEKKAIDDLLKKGVIQKSTSPWASPIVLVKKKSGAIRPCVDYRKVNALVKQDGFPLPRVQDCLDAVAGASVFSSFDLTSGYFQIPLKQEDIPKSAFVCKFGQFEMTRMPFGLNNSSSTFQRMMEIALQGLQWEICLVYIDDIIVYGANLIQHLHRVDHILNRIQSAGLKLRPDKVHLLQTEVVFLGHIVSKDGVRPDPSNIS